ncbi:MAG: glycine cleavage system aminomethyltransferase GcvT [Propionibacterium sp.]|nr:glycine cleavage system aminomethyltransferase GcvT [Propionibacterium sp.]MDN6795515.1 glycine cleavage system aminomethyltransferase GcvT [Propionibacterium sp.]
MDEDEADMTTGTEGSAGAGQTRAQTTGTDEAGTMDAGARRSPLHDRETALGASFTDFAGWEMPLQYTSSLAEHQAVRTAAGLFDLSHMGELHVQGRDAVELLGRTFVSDFSTLRVGRAKYTMLCDEGGGIVDDLIIYRLEDQEFLVVPNAANATTVAQTLAATADGLDVGVEDRTLSTALIALQGPRAEEILVNANSAHRAHPAEIEALRQLPYYAGIHMDYAGVDAVVARTGYTGEDGFELFVPWELAGETWDLLMDVGSHDALVPAGLGARDSLRLEAGMPLCGHELTRETSPFQVGAGRVVSLTKPQDFPGRAALERASKSRPDVVLVGLSADGRRAMREGCPVLTSDSAAEPGRRIGTVTSGLYSPTLGHAIAMALVEADAAALDTVVTVDVRGHALTATVRPLAAYKRPR